MTLTKSIANRAFLICALGITLGSLALSYAFSGAESTVIQTLRDSFGMQSISLPVSRSALSFVSVCANSIVVFFVSLAACFAGNLSWLPRSICCFQLFVVSII